MAYDGEGIKVCLELSLRAKNLLAEEFPLAESGIKEENGKWYYHGMVGLLEGVGRFCIGLDGDIKVVDSQELKQYIQGFINRSL